MQRNSVMAALVFASVLASVCPAGAPDGWPRIGSIQPRHAKDISASNWSVGAETMDRDYTIYANWKDWLGPLGVKKARLQAGWAKTEKQPGVYDFRWLDEIVFDMAAQGVEPWMCLCYGNAAYTGGGGTRLGAQIPQDEPSLRAWTLWVRAVVSRYKEVIDEWEIWNEPNLRGANANQRYAEFLLHTAAEVRAIQPNAKILGLSMAGVKPDFADEVLAYAKQQGKLDLIDQITYHPYKPNPDGSYPAVERLRDAVRKHSDRITLRQGENGCPSMRRRTKALSGHDWTETSQAKWALRRLLGDLGRDIESSYFAIMDMKYPDEMNAKGLLRSRDDQTVDYAKPAYYAVQNLASVFDDRLERITEFAYDANTDESLSVFGYRNKETGRQVATIWMDGEIPSDSQETQPVDLTFLAGRFEDPVYVDLRTGEVHAIPEANYSVDRGVYRFTGIPVYDSPVLIADRSTLFLRDAGQ